jgi:hypothetical protein
VSSHVSLARIGLGVAIPDFAITCLVTIVERRPRLLLSAVFFPLMRVLDAAIGLYAIPQAWLARSNGVWKSPARRRALRGAVAAGPLIPPAAPPDMAAAGTAVPAAAAAGTTAASAAAWEAEQQQASG